jgi:hypothetical protein
MLVLPAAETPLFAGGRRSQHLDGQAQQCGRRWRIMSICLRDRARRF